LAVTKKGILNKLYIVFVFVTILLIAVVVRLTNIQFADGDKYRSLSEQLTLEMIQFLLIEGMFFLLMEVC